MDAFQEFEHPQFRFRAIFCEGVDVSGHHEHDGLQSIWLWWVGDLTLDEWMAMGISDKLEPAMVDFIADQALPGEIETLLPYMGETWSDLMAVSPVQYGNMQRELVAQIKRENVLPRLMELDRDALVALRAAETGQTQAWLN